MPDPGTEEAIAFMNDFAERTGLVSGYHPQRYLWTDAFAVCNFLGLTQATGNERYTELALRLVDQVHHTLGRHRIDDPRSGWISGLSEHEGELHPTRGGLRIGKNLPERDPEEPYDERLEWDRDGQYFHYLTKWMHALDQVTRATGQPRFNLWARELAKATYDSFTFLSPSPLFPSAAARRRMHWKMSIDLRRALVPSMGQHDPLDGYLTFVQLHATAAELSETNGGPSLADEISQLAAMIEEGEWTTPDPLGIGGLLMDAHRVDWLLRHGAVSDEHLLETLLSASLVGLQYYADNSDLQQPAEYRLAFRELGLAIGLHALELMWQAAGKKAQNFSTSSGFRTRLKALNQYAPLRNQIESFWRDPDHRHANSWTAHGDINEVMLATSLTPHGFLTRRSWPVNE